MSKILFSIFFLAFTFSNLYSAVDTEQVKQRNVIKIGWFNQYPFTYEKKVFGIKTLTGLDIELSRAITSKADFEPEFIKRPWNMQLKMLRDGAIDVMLSGLESPERFKEFRISLPIRKETTVIYSRADEDKINFINVKLFLEWIKDKNVKLGITKGNIYTDTVINSFISDQNNSKYIQAADNDVGNLKNLKNGNVFFALTDRTAGASIIYENNWTNIFKELYSPTFKALNVCYLLSKKSTTVNDLDRINASISSIKKDGEYNTILKKLSLSGNTQYDCKYTVVFLHCTCRDYCLLHLCLENSNGGKAEFDWNVDICIYLYYWRWFDQGCNNWKIPTFFLSPTYLHLYCYSPYFTCFSYCKCI